jgi:hypothetical protein
MVLLVLLGCTSPEDEASAAALEFAGAARDAAVVHRMACPEDQAAMTVEEVGELTTVGGLFAGIVAELEKKVSRSVAEVALLEEGARATVTVVTKNDDEQPGFTEHSLRLLSLRHLEDRWCVETGWAEAKRVAAGIAAASELGQEVQAHLDLWQMDEARAKLASAKEAAASLPSEHTASLTRLLEALETAVKARSEGHVGGRWIVTTSIDPMTDVQNVVAVLESTEVVESQFGEHHAHLIGRCRDHKLEMYITTPNILDADWRYDSVRGRHRIGESPAEDLSGSRSKDHKSVFLRNPTAWVKRLTDADGSNWTVELPQYNRLPFTIKFDLTAAKKALPKLVDVCAK